MAKQTAVDWFYEEIWKQFGFSCSSNIFDKAKEMEKHQIVTAHLSGQSVFDTGAYREEVKKYAEQYYQETYKSEKDKGCACYGNNAVHKCYCK